MEVAGDLNSSYRPSSSDDGSDLHLFESRLGPALARKILRIKRNDPQVKRLFVNSFDDFDEPLWRRLGCILGCRGTKMIEELTIVHRNLDVATLCAGLQTNQSIQVVSLDGINLRDAAKMVSLASFLSRNRSLKKIYLGDCKMGQAGANILSSALSNRPVDTLEELNLGGNHLGNDDVNRLVLALEGRRLTRLWLSYNGIGAVGCVSLAKLLKIQSNLEELYLSNNNIDNEAVIVLVKSLTKNTKLKELALGGNNRITCEGWTAVLKLLCNDASINDVLDSNHTINYLGLFANDEKAINTALGPNDADRLFSSLKVNTTTNKILVARKKILWGHCRGNVNLGDASIATVVVTRILAWFANQSHANLLYYRRTPIPTDAVRLDSIYRILQSMPDLCLQDE